MKQENNGKIPGGLCRQWNDLPDNTGCRNMEQEGETLLGRFFGGSVAKFVNCLYDKNRLSTEDIRELKRFVEEFEEKSQ